MAWWGITELVIGLDIFYSEVCQMFRSGLGWNLPVVVVGRLVAGVGGAGINCLVSIVIADMVPIREVAKWRSYVNIAATTRRSLGGPIGGFLTDTIGWRWSFLAQCPPTILALMLVIWKLDITPQ
ncbi:hypothetical protein BCON_0011g00870 [Botryotinia convoluta]|uniref:Major facilitator superfamily (MFS) profile domain-containing protein n=1 Tax=Botryotinia convoluta TaxID=54673 RepID=A0A4Z1J3U8_9HELO|nr:hypothetical protein BCON_0011g00870 [Botryotinia convoluta]